MPVQDLCVDITKPLTVQWTHVKQGGRLQGSQLQASTNEDEITNSNLAPILPIFSFQYWNKAGEEPNVEELIPIGGFVPLVVSTSLDTYTLPAVSDEVAKRYRNNSINGFANLLVT